MKKNSLLTRFGIKSILEGYFYFDTTRHKKFMSEIMSDFAA